MPPIPRYANPVPITGQRLRAEMGHKYHNGAAFGNGIYTLLSEAAGCSADEKDRVSQSRLGEQIRSEIYHQEIDQDPQGHETGNKTADHLCLLRAPREFEDARARSEATTYVRTPIT